MTFLLPNDIVYVYSFNSFYCGKVSFVVKKHKMLSEIHYYFKPERKNVMKRRLLAFLMCAVMIIGIFPGAVFATEDAPVADENTVVVEEPEDKTTEEPNEDIVDPDKPTEPPEVPETPETTPEPQNPEGTTEGNDEESEENQEKSEEEVKTETEVKSEEESETETEVKSEEESETETEVKSEEDNNAFAPLYANDGNPIAVQDSNDNWYKVDWKLFNGYNDGYCISDSRDLSPTVTLDSNTWSSGEKKDISTVKSGTVHITPPAGYYVRQVVICCNDWGGYRCKTNAAGDVDRENYTPVNGTSVELKLSRDGYWHHGAGYPSHLMIWLQKIPDPVTVTYVAGIEGYTGKVSDLENDKLSIPTTSGAPTHIVAGISEELSSYAKNNNLAFEGWELSFYNDEEHRDLLTTDKTLKTTNTSFSVVTHAVLEAQWKKVETAGYKIEHKLITGIDNNGKITSTKSMYDINEAWPDTKGTAAVGDDIDVARIDFGDDDTYVFVADHSYSEKTLTVTSDPSKNVATFYYKLNTEKVYKQDYLIEWYLPEDNGTGYKLHKSEKRPEDVTYAINGDPTPATVKPEEHDYSNFDFEYPDGSTKKYIYDPDYTEKVVEADLQNYFELSEENLPTLKLYYKIADKYTVTYKVKYPDGSIITKLERSYYADTSVKVADRYEETGFTASPWEVISPASGFTITGGEFKMPAEDVIFQAELTADQYSYTINYLDKDTNKPIKEASTNPAAYGEVIKVEEKVIPIDGYSFSYADPKEKLTIGTENNVINLYYTKNSYSYKINYVDKVTGKNIIDPEEDTLTITDKIYVVEKGKAKLKDPEFKDYEYDSADLDEITVTDPKNPNKVYEATVYYTKKAEEVEKFKVYYYVDGKLYHESEEKAGDTVDVLAKLRDKTNYTFKGWYLESPEDLTIRFGRFTMPKEDVVFYGYYEFDSIDIPIIKDGYIRIEKNLIAPNDFSGSTVFTFDIYKDGNDDDDYYTTVKVAAGDFEKIKVPTGVYYIYEVDAEEEGYTLISASDAQNNRIVVEGGKTRTVTFKNVYTEEAKLETEDHFGYIIGYPDGTVKPQGNITRAEIATIFFRLLTDDARDYYWSQTNDFTDVSADDWFNNAISTLANAGILSGYEDGSFRPNAAITRAELVKIAVSFYDSDAAEDSGFSDVEGHWADMFINAAYGRGFISGYGDGTFKPDQAVTRAEAMKIINRTLDRHPDADHLLRGMITFSDNMDKDAWYYAEVQEATNSHEYEWTSYELEDWTELLPIRDWAALEKAYSDAYAG